MISVVDDRIETLRQRLKHNGCFSEAMAEQRRMVYERVFAETRGEPQVLRRGKALAAFLAEKDVSVFVEDVLAGLQQTYDFREPMDLPSLEAPAIASRAEESYCPMAVAAGAAPDAMADFCAGFQIGLFTSSLGGHVIAGYDRVIATGVGVLVAAAQVRLETAEGEARDFAEASVIVCEAFRDYIGRYADQARAVAAETDVAAFGDQLRAVAAACEWIAAERPRTFLEAAQLVALMHEVITAEQASGSLSLGRLDQYLHPFYQADLAAGRLGKDEAEEIIQALWLKFGALKGAYQNVTLGGCDAAGAYVGNDLTVMGLRASARLKMDQPLVSFRWHPAMPVEFWERVLDLLGEGLGFPAMFNDEVVIDAKCRVGLDRADAADYGAVGCVEMAAGGREWSQTEAVRINWAKALELMLNDGRCTLTGEPTPLRADVPLAELATFEGFLDCYKRVFGRLIDMAAEWTVVRDEGFPLLYPTPFLSSTMAGCLESGRDVSAGGTTYNLLTMNNCGMADTADSLLAIKHLVYEASALTLAELAEALRTNFAGADDLRAQLAEAGPHFGTDRDEADLLVRDLAELLHERLADYRNVRGGGYQIGMYTVDSHAWLGKATGALPSGRPAGVSLASGFSPRQGADTAGPTAVVRSLTKLDHRQFGNGMVLDIKFSPSIFDDSQGRQALRKLIETYFTLGGLEIQFNVIDRKTLTVADEALLREQAGAIDLDAEARVLRRDVGAVIVATGWRPYDATRLTHLGYGRFPNVVTNVELERLAARRGPTKGAIERPSDGRPAENVAFVQCAGSRDENHLAYCSAVCCMASLKHVRYLRERNPEARATVFYIDLRTIGRLERFLLDTLEDPLVTPVKGKVARVAEDAPSGDLRLDVEDTVAGATRHPRFDLVVLATGMVPNGAGFATPRDTYGFVAPGADGDGVFAAGCARRPCDVSRATKDATAAAMRAIRYVRRQEE